MIAEIVAQNINWTLIFTIIMSLATLGLWWDARRQPALRVEQPLQTTKVWPSASVKELEDAQMEVRRRLLEHDKEISALRELIRVELPAMERRITAENEHRSIALHQRINEILEAVSEMRGQINGHQ